MFPVSSAKVRSGLKDWRVLPEAAGMKLFCISGHVAKRACFELPLGIPLGEIIESSCGGMRSGSSFKACLPGGASTPYLSADHWNLPMDFDPVAKAGSRLGTGGIVVFDQDTCMVAATLNLIRFFTRESCGWCTPCREGLPYVQHILETIEAGNGSEEHIDILQDHVNLLNYSFCALAPGAMGPVQGLLRQFMDELREHIVKRRCPFKQLKDAETDHRQYKPLKLPKALPYCEAAQSVGIPIPHFCWHPALGKAGACRVCAVKMLDGPVKGIQMSCMLQAQDGMVVSTTDEEAMAMRRQVIEWLMINHPHDCPVCDEGGECQLQDFTIAGGHGLRRYTRQKTYTPKSIPGNADPARDEPLYPMLPMRPILSGICRWYRFRGHGQCRKGILRAF